MSPPRPSSTPGPMRPRPSPPTPSCPSSAPSRGPRAFRSRRATSRWPAASSRSFPSASTPSSACPMSWAALGRLVKTPEANVIKLPNISASIPQLQGGDQKNFSRRVSPCSRLSRRTVPPMPSCDDPGTLRQGQGQRRQPGAARGQLRPARPPKAVKEYARKNNPHPMGAWSPDSKRTHVATWARVTSARTSSRPRGRRRHRGAHRARRCAGRHDDRPEGRYPAAGRRGRSTPPS